VDKGGLAILIGKMRPKGMAAHSEPDGDESGGEEYGPEEGLKVAAKEVREALESKDDEALAEALHSFFMECDAMPHKEGEHEEEE
jgi:hypothetical protein